MANLNASLLGGIGSGDLVKGGGHMKTAQVTVSAGKSATLLSIPPYGSFTAICATVVSTRAELQFRASSDPLHLWVNVVSSTSSEASLIEQDLAPAGIITFASVAANQLNFTIQDAKSGNLNTHVASAQAVEMVSGGSCDFAVVVSAGP